MLTETLVSADSRPGVRVHELGPGDPERRRLERPRCCLRPASRRCSVATTAPLVCGVTTLGGIARPGGDGFVVSGTLGVRIGMPARAVGRRRGSLRDRAQRVAASTTSPCRRSAPWWSPCPTCRSRTPGTSRVCAPPAATPSSPRTCSCPSHRVLTVPNGVVAMLERSPQVPRFAVALLGPAARSRRGPAGPRDRQRQQARRQLLPPPPPGRLRRLRHADRRRRHAHRHRLAARPPCHR